jgi:hypothetical protein
MVGVTYTNKRRDAIAFNAHVITRSWFNLLFIAAFVLATLPSTIAEQEPQLSLAEKVAVTAITEILLLAGVFAFAAVVMVLAIVFQRQSGIYEQHTLTADADKLRETTAVNDTVMSWSAVRKIAMTPFHIFVCVGPRAGFIIPYRDVQSEAEWHSLHESLVACWSESKRLARGAS